MISTELIGIYVSLWAESERRAMILKNSPMRDREFLNVINCLYVYIKRNSILSVQMCESSAL